ncbi:MAG: hypothetical protein HYV01_18115 [Deltaproteobacteria bacterium]|nr:hypothetical protein [Deltaproteobacteria bacterium]
MSTRRKAMARRPGVAADILALEDSCGSKAGGSVTLVFGAMGISLSA